jgi:hypothetical protein
MEGGMNGSYYRDTAERCRLMWALAIVPEVKAQLKLGAREMDGLAEEADRKHERRDRLRKWRNQMRRMLRGAAA